MPWDLIIDGPLDGVSNMAVDSELLDEVESSTAPRTVVRFYQWRRPTVSLGRNQQIVSAVDQVYCQDNSIEEFQYFGARVRCRHGACRLENEA